jgi:hypothetical protein
MIIDTLTRKQTIELFYGYKDQHGNTLIKSDAFQELINIAKPDTDSNMLKHLFTRLSILNGYSPDKLMKPGRATQDIIEIRNILCYVLYHTPSLNLTYKKLAELISKDHTTTVHGIQVVESEMKVYRHVTYKVQKVKSQLAELLL